jgi:two-component system, chemotaxis family, sensor kinase CheA
VENEELLGDFLEECYDLIEKVRRALADWHGSQEKEELINSIYRWIHTIKGGCAIFDYKNTFQVSHELESRLGELKKNHQRLMASELAHIEKEVNRIESLLQNSDTLTAETQNDTPQIQAGESSVSHSRYFTEFFSAEGGLVDDMVKDGTSFFEVVIPEEIVTKVLTRLDGAGIVSVQDKIISGGQAHLLGANIRKNPALEEIIEGLLVKFNGRWCRKPDGFVTRPTAVAEAEITNPDPVVLPKSTAPVANAPGEVLRVPLTTVNSLLENIWELFLVHNQMSHLMKQNAQVFKEHHHLLQQFDSLDTVLERSIHELESKTMGMRMSPLKKIFDRMNKVVTDYAQQSGKKINFITTGDGIDLDKKVLDMLNEPLIHLVRNAIDHGIETVATRQKTGKSDIGNVTLAAHISGNEVHITLKDDGKGIDPVKVKESAIKKGLDVGHLRSEQDFINLIFAPGFSTAEQVSDISGRGVGMDAVKKSIHELGGEVNIQTEVGKGTAFKIALPISMSVSKSLIVNVRDVLYAFSTKAIVSVEKINANSLQRNGRNEYYLFNDEPIPCYNLAEFLPDHRKHADLPISFTHVCVIKDMERVMAFRVDEIVQTLNLVMKPLSKVVPKQVGIGGVSILPDGNPIFALNVLEIIEIIKSRRNGGEHVGSAA